MINQLLLSQAPHELNCMNLSINREEISPYRAQSQTNIGITAEAPLAEITSNIHIQIAAQTPENGEGTKRVKYIDPASLPPSKANDLI